MDGFRTSCDGCCGVSCLRTPGLAGWIGLVCAYGSWLRRGVLYGRLGESCGVGWMDANCTYLWGSAGWSAGALVDGLGVRFMRVWAPRGEVYMW